jgi:hypothetical protein
MEEDFLFPHRRAHDANLTILATPIKEHAESGQLANYQTFQS